MSSLGNRLTALERRAERVRRRGIRGLVMSIPEARDLTPPELEEAIDEALHLLDVTASWCRAGLSEHQIVQRGITEFKLSAEAVEADYRAITSPPPVIPKRAVPQTEGSREHPERPSPPAGSEPAEARHLPGASGGADVA